MNSDIDAGSPSQPYRAIVALIRHAQAWVTGSSIGVLLLVLWLAWRTGWSELVILAPIAALVVYFVIRVAVDVVALVADTLMPR